MTKTIAVDVHDTVCDLIGGIMPSLNKKLGSNYATEDITDWSWSKSLGLENGQQIFNELFTPELQLRLPEIPGAGMGLQMLHDAGHKLFFATATYAKMGAAVESWLIDHDYLGDFSRLNMGFMIVRDKSTIRADILIDDKPDNIQVFEAAGGIGILFSRPWNLKFDHPLRANNWEEVVTLVQISDAKEIATNRPTRPELETLVIDGSIWQWDKSLGYAMGVPNLVYSPAVSGRWHDGFYFTRVKPVGEAQAEFMSQAEEPPSYTGGTGSSGATPLLPAKAIAKPDLTTGYKADENKILWHLLPFAALAEVTKVLMFGAGKYDEWNWAKGMRWTKPTNAALRHIFAFLAGEDLDRETGLHHLAHAMCELLFVFSYVLAGMYKLDDRPQGFTGVTLPATRYEK